MALKFGELFAEIGADTSGLRRADKEVQRTAKGMEKSFAGLGRVIAAALSFEAVRRTILLADKMNMLDQQIRNVVKNAASFNKIRDGVRDIAKETGNSIESVTRLTQALIIAGESMGATDDQVVEMTSNLNKLGIIGGASGEAMSNSMRQFGQAMAGGVVRAEEFNSIVENTPLIAKAIADGMGVSTGELRKMVIEGKVLSEEVFRALQLQTDSINKKFAAMPLTVDRASGMIANSFAVAMQELDTGFGTTEDIAEVMKEISEIIGEDLVPFIDDMVNGIEEFLFMLDEVTASTQDTANDTFDLAQSWKLVTEFFSFFVKAIKELPANIKDITTIIVGEFDKLFLVRGKAAIQKFTMFFTEGMFSAIAKVKASFFDFLSSIDSGIASAFRFIGLDSLAASHQAEADKFEATSKEITEKALENQLARADIIDQEIAKINERVNVQLTAANMAIQMGLTETEELKRQSAERAKVRDRERKDRRKVQKDIAGEEEKIKKVLERTNAEKLKDMSAFGAASDTLAHAGIISDKNNALIQLGISSAIAVAKTGELGFPQALPFIATALANIANARGMLSGAGRQFGGSATGGLPIPVNEGGPEMFVNNAGRQFLLPDQSGKVVPLNASGKESGGVNLIINNNAAGVEVTPTTMSNGQIMIEIAKATQSAIDQVNGSLAAGRGGSAEALRSGFTQTRNI